MITKRSFIAAVLFIATAVASTVQAQVGNMYAWGLNESGMLDVPTPPAGVKYISVAGSRYSSLAVRSDGQLAAFGNNSWGNLNVPALPAGVSYVKAAAPGHGYNTVALRSDGQVVAWGYNGYGECNIPALPAGMTYTDVAGSHHTTVLLRSDGNILGFGWNGWGNGNAPALPAGVKYTAIHGQYHHVLALRSDGQAVAFGHNGWGNTVVPSLPAGLTYTKVAAGYYHSLALRSDGNVIAFGYNGQGECNVPALPAGMTYTAIAAGQHYSYALRSDGRLIGWGYNGWNNLNTPTIGAGSVFTDVASGWHHVLALKKDYVTVTMNGSGTQQILLGGTYNEQGATATDEVGNSLSVTTTGAVDSNTIGTYQITYTATDSGGRVGSATRVVQVVKKLASDLWVAAMPSYQQSQSYANAALNQAITVWGRAWNGTAPYSYTLDYGDGTAPLTGTANASQATFIGAAHTYTSTGSKTVTLTVTDAGGRTVSRQSVIRVLLAPTHGERVNMAIEKGLIHLYKKQIVRNANEIYWWSDSNHEYYTGTTAASILSFAENGHLASNDYEQDIYAETVMRGVNWLVGKAGYNNISTTVAGQNPDTNGDGKGISFPGVHIGHHTYAHSFATMGLIMAFPNAQTAQNIFVPAGINAAFTGASYYSIGINALDMLNYSQSEGWGGWHYDIITASSGSPDGSTHQWPNLAYLFAKDRWNVTAPTWVVSRSVTAMKNLQNANGGVGYGSNSSWLTAGKTGGGLVAFFLGNKRIGDNDVDRGIAFIARNWFSTIQTGQGQNDAGWLGEFYAMYGIKKGLQLQEVTTIATPQGTRDWYDDFSAWLLGNGTMLGGSLGNGLRDINNAYGQSADGRWNTGQWPIGAIGSADDVMETGHAILVLTKALTKPLPIAIVAPVPDQSSRNPSAFTLNGSGSFHLDPSASIIEWLWVLDGGANPNWNNPIASGPVVSVNPGWNSPGVHTATLRVKDNQNPANFATATVTINVLNTDVAPVAVPIPASQIPAIYTGQLGSTISLNGIESYDPDGDPIIAYAWDLDGNGTYADAADRAKDTSGNNAQGVTASLVFTAEYNGQIGLRVTSRPPSGPDKSSNNNASIDVQASPSDLFVQTVNAYNVVAGTSADITAVLVSAAGSGKDANNIQVRFYNGDPLSGGAPIGSIITTSILKGDVLTVNATVPLTGGVEEVWVYVDAGQDFSEYNEANNTGFVNVSNQPPSATLPSIGTLGCNELLTITAQVGDADNDAITVTWTVDGEVFEVHELAAGASADSITHQFGFGSHLVEVTVTDGEADPVTTSVEFEIADSVAPLVTCPANISVNNDAGSCGAVVSYADPEGSDDCAGAIVTQIAGLPSGATFPIGTTLNTFQVRDAAGNTVECSFTVTVLDNELPVIACVDNISVNNDAGQCGAVVTYATPVGADNCSGATTVQIAGLPSGAQFPVGTTVNTFEVTDASGNRASCSFTVTVTDNVAPSLVVPGAIVVPNDPGACGALVAYSISADDNCPGVTSGTDIASGSFFPTGTTTVTARAVDAAGNETVSTFTVTVNDVQAPALTLPANITVSTDPGQCSAVVAFEILAGDNCAVASVVSSSHSGDVFPKGTTTVSATVTDTSGNVTSGSFTITVVDTEKPVISCPADIVLSNNPGSCTRSNVVFSATASDNCDVTISYSIAPGSTFALGVTPVTATATDSAGNSSSCTFTVTINFTENPGGLYPIALAASTIAGKAPGTLLGDIYNGTQPGNFGWLTWGGAVNEPTLQTSLTAPGDSFTYKNPANASDNVISIGDWVQGKPGISNSSGVRAALDKLKTMDINVPVWDQTTGNGSNTKYRIVGFAKVRITSYELPGKTRISARYLGSSCQ